jgi:hydroxymethylpyrimidine/phosphomethylpyrimidine kinase
MVGEPRTYEWLRHGFPVGAPVIACQVRTMRLARGREKEKLRADFAEILGPLKPENVLIYGGKENRDWLTDYLYPGPTYHYLSSFMAARSAWKKTRQKSKGDA